MAETLTIEDVKKMYDTLRKSAAEANPYIVVVNPKDQMIPVYKRLGYEVITTEHLIDVGEENVLVIDKRKFQISFKDRANE